jgi:hypothetical protein
VAARAARGRLLRAGVRRMTASAALRIAAGMTGPLLVTRAALDGGCVILRAVHCMALGTLLGVRGDRTVIALRFGMTGQAIACRLAGSRCEQEVVTLQARGRVGRARMDGQRAIGVAARASIRRGALELVVAQLVAIGAGDCPRGL